MNEINNRVKDILVELLSLDKEPNNSDNLQTDLGLDSLDYMEIIMEVEKEFGINIPDEYTENIFTVSDLVNIINKIINE